MSIQKSGNVSETNLSPTATDTTKKEWKKRAFLFLIVLVLAVLSVVTTYYVRFYFLTHDEHSVSYPPKVFMESVSATLESTHVISGDKSIAVKPDEYDQFLAVQTALQEDSLAMVFLARKAKLVDWVSHSTDSNLRTAWTELETQLKSYIEIQNQVIENIQLYLDAMDTVVECLEEVISCKDAYDTQGTETSKVAYMAAGENYDNALNAANTVFQELDGDIDAFLPQQSSFVESYKHFKQVIV